MESNPSFVVIVAPQGAGKTRNAEALKSLLGCTCVVDDWDGETALPFGALALTSQRANSVPVKSLAKAG